MGSMLPYIAYMDPMGTMMLHDVFHIFLTGINQSSNPPMMPSWPKSQGRLVAEFFHGLGIDHLMIYARDIHKVVHHDDVCCCITPLPITIDVTCILHQA